MESVTDENTLVKHGDALLIELVSQFPCLYDKSLKEYKNNSFREAAWLKISEVMHMTPSECSKRWGQLRDNFGREKRRREEECRSGSGLSQRRGFTFFEDMRFLELHVQKRKTFTNVRNSPQPLSDGYEHNSQLIEGCLATISNAIIPPRVETTVENLDAVQLSTLLQPAETALPPPVTITTSIQSAITPTFVSPGERGFSESTDKMTASLSTTLLTRFSHTATTQFQPATTALLYSPSTLAVPYSLSSTFKRPPAEISTPQVTMKTTSSSLEISNTDPLMTKLLSHSSVITPPIMTPPLSPIIRTTSSPLDTTPVSSVSPLTSPPPVTTPIPFSISTARTFHSPQTLTRNTLSTTPTPPPHTSTSTDDMVYPWSTGSVSPCTSESSSQSFTSTAMPEANDQWHSIPSAETSPNSYSTIVRKPTPLKNNRSRLTSNIEATTCFDKKLEKAKKTDPIESSFLSLSTAIQQHFTNRMQTEDKVKNHIAVPRSDEAFANLIAAELSNLDEAKRAVKKAKLLAVLYEP